MQKAKTDWMAYCKRRDPFERGMSPIVRACPTIPGQMKRLMRSKSCA